MTDFTAQHAVGAQLTGATGYVTYCPCSAFEGNGVKVYFDSQANAEAEWTARGGTIKTHGPINFNHAVIDGIEVFFSWDTP